MWNISQTITLLSAPLAPNLMDLCEECQQVCNVDNAKHEVHCECNNGYLMDSSDGCIGKCNL